MKVAIVGGGVAGLAAGYELVEAGHEVALYEAGPVFGGQVRTFEIGGGRIEAFYHHVFRSDTEIAALIEELGLGADLEWIDSRVALHGGGRTYPFTTARDLLAFDRVSPLTRLRLGLAALYLRRQSDWRRFEGRRAADWIRSRVGNEGYERVWGPLLRAKFGPEAEDVSLAWFWGKLHLRFASREGGLGGREQLGYLRGSFGRLVDALVERLRERGALVEAGRPVERVLVEGGRARGLLVAGRDGAAAECVTADAVIATVPSPIFARAVPELDAAYRALLDGVRYQWATVLVLALDRPLTEHYWVTMTDPECPFVAAVEQTNFRRPEEYGGRHVLYLSNYVEPGSPLVDEGADALLDRYEPWLARLNPDYRRDWVREHWLFTDRAGQPVVHSRYHETLAPHRTPTPGLYLANTTQIYPEDRGQNYSIRMGRRVARLVLADAPAEVRADAPSLRASS